MANEIVPFTPGKLSPVPSHIAKFFEKHENISERINIPQLSFRGKTWRIVINGQEEPLVNSKDEPVQTVHVVIIDQATARSRAYYEGTYEVGKASPPSCWATDGKVPDASVPEPKAKTCEACPFSKKGSKITANNKPTTACSVFKRIAVVPLQDLDSEILLLRLPQTSLWDKDNEENEAKGWYAFDQYLDMLRKNGAKHTAMIATKIKFDLRKEYPKLLFGASRWLVDEESAITTQLVDDERVPKILAAPEIQTAARAQPPVPADDGEEFEQAASTYDDDEDAPPPPKVKAEAPPPPKVDMEAVKARVPEKVKVVAADDDDAPPPPRKGKAVKEDDDAVPPPSTAAKRAQKKAEPQQPVKSNGKGNAGLADLVQDWDKE